MVYHSIGDQRLARKKSDRPAADAARILNAFRTLVKALRLADRAAVKRYGVGAAQIFVLHELDRESPLSVNDLAARTATDQSTVSVVVNKLVARGLVDNSRAEADARRAELALTAKGRQLVRKLPPPIQQALLNAFRELPASSVTVLADSLEQVVERIGVGEEHPPMFFEDGTKPAARRRK